MKIEQISSTGAQKTSIRIGLKDHKEADPRELHPIDLLMDVAESYQRIAVELKTIDPKEKVLKVTKFLQSGELKEMKMRAEMRVTMKVIEVEIERARSYLP